MKFTIEQSAFKRALDRTIRVVPSNTTLDILRSGLIRVSDGRLSIETSDTEIWIVASEACETVGAGAFCIDANRLRAFVAALPDGAQVECQHNADKQTVTLHSGRARVTLSTAMADEFPQRSDHEMLHRFTLPAADFARALGFAEPAAERDGRYYMMGVCMDLGPLTPGGSRAGLRFTATDGHRLFRIVLDVPTGAGGIPAVIIPSKAAQIVPHLFDEGEVEVAVGPRLVTVATGGLTLATKLIDGSFPDADRVIPTEQDNTLEIDREALLAAMRRIGVVLDRKDWQGMELDLNWNRCVISAKGALGDADEEIAAAWSGRDMRVGVQIPYMRAILAGVGETARLAISGPGNPILITDPDSDDRLWVQMPYRV